MQSAMTRPSPSREHQLRLAAMEGRKSDVLNLLREASINDADSCGWSALFFAAHAGHDEIVACLLDHGANIDQQDVSGDTVIIIAAEKGRDKVVQLLANRGASIHEKNDDKKSALMYAATNGHRTTVEVLLEQGARVDDRDKDNASPLILAATEGHEEVVHLLLNRGARISDKSNLGWTSLHWAVAKGHAEIARILLNAGADVHEKDMMEGRPLLIATTGSHVEVVKVLLEFGANPFDPCDYSYGETLLMRAAGQGCISLVQLYLDLGININAKCSDGVTALRRAVCKSHTRVVKLLLKKGALINNADNNALFLAAHEAKSQTLLAFLQHGANIYSKDKSGRRPMQVVSKPDRGRKIQELLKWESQGMSWQFYMLSS